jgi:hypothetical protein
LIPSFWNGKQKEEEERKGPRGSKLPRESCRVRVID